MPSPTQINWVRDTKRQARSSVLTMLRERGLSKIPQGKQYWTLAGTFYDAKTGSRLEGLEPDHLIEEGFMTPSQYQGVDQEADIVALNRAVCPDYTVHHGDLIDVIYRHIQAKTFRPAVIHVDTMNEAGRGVDLFMRVLRATLEVKGPVHCIFNVVAQNHVYQPDKTTEECHQELTKAVLSHYLLGEVQGHYDGLTEALSYEGRQHLMMTLLASPRGTT